MAGRDASVGGVGAEEAFIPHDTPAPISTVCSAFGIAAPNGDGLCGGMPARTGFYRLARDTRVRAAFAAREVPLLNEEIGGVEEWLPPKLGAVSVGHDDVYHTAWFGGGGYGDPLEREPSAVARDVREGYVSPEEARTAYGVVLTDEEADVEATRRLRERLRGERLGREPMSEPPRAVLPEGGHWFDENLVMTAEGAVACGRCAHVLDESGRSYKSGTTMLQRTLEEVGRVWMPPSHYVDDEVALRQYVCPGCGTLLENEVCLTALEPVDDKRLALR